MSMCSFQGASSNRNSSDFIPLFILPINKLTILGGQNFKLGLHSKKFSFNIQKYPKIAVIWLLDKRYFRTIGL